MVRVGRKRLGGRLRVRLLVAMVAVGCAGESIDSAPGDTPDVEMTTGGSGGNGGSTPGAGGKLGASGGSVASAGKGGSIAGRAGAAGATPTAGRGGSMGAPRECTFEALPDRIRCADSAAYAQSSSLEKVPGVTELDACESACEAHGDCTGVVFYPPFETPQRCELYTLPCDAPGPGVSWEENAAKEYRKVCEDECRLEFVGLWNRCEGADIDPMVGVPGADSAEDCFEACLANPDCTGVSDYLWLDEVSGCYLATGECASTATLPPGDPGKTYLAECDAVGGAGAGGVAGETGDPEPKPPTRLALGESHTCLLLTDGSVRCWGSDAHTIPNEYGDIVVRGTVHPPTGRFTRLAANRYTTCGTDQVGTAECWSYAWPGDQTEVTDIDGDPLGSYLELRADGQAYGSAGRFFRPKLFTSIAAGSSMSCGLDDTAHAVCTGEVTPPDRAFRRIVAGGGHACGLLFSGGVLCWGASDGGATDAPGGEFEQIATGSRHSCGIRANGSIECWGANDLGQSNPPSGRFESVETGANHSCAIRSGDQVECWGSNEGFQSAPPSDLRPPTQPLIAVAVGGGALYNGLFVSGGGTEDEEPWSEWTPVEHAAHGCGVRAGGDLECFGDGKAARPPSGTFLAVSAGLEATCALRASGIVCFGSPENSLDGLSISGTFVDVSTGWELACAVSGSGALTCWGMGGTGAILSPPGVFSRVAAGGGGGHRWAARACGIRDDESITCFTQVDGDVPGELDVPGHFADVAVGYTHACALTDQGAVTCWDTTLGTALPAPTGTFDKVVAGDHQSCALRTDGSVTCWVVEDWATPLEFPGDVAGPFVDLSMGGDFACGVQLADGGIKCWGSHVR
jgi:hypothetical protein